jgi:predicted RNA polymerase sigma factor
MSNTLRVPLILRDADGLAYEEIAEMLGIGLSAVKMRIKRAREEFRARYGSRDLPGGPAPPERSDPVTRGAEPPRRTRTAGGRG